MVVLGIILLIVFWREIVSAIIGFFGLIASIIGGHNRWNNQSI